MDTRVKLSIIAAVSENGVIGRNGDLPWKLRADLARFSRRTRHHMVIMGHTTYLAISNRLGGTLPDRGTIMLTHRSASELIVPRSVVLAHSWEEAVERSRGAGEVFVVGGANVYAQSLPVADRIYLTTVHATIPDGDVFFPEWVESLWVDEVPPERHEADSENEYATTFRILRRKGHEQNGSSPRRGFVHLDNARADGQREVMTRFEQLDQCPFCGGSTALAEINPAIWNGDHWRLVVNRWPYESTWLHLLAIPHRHVTRLNELSIGARAELMELLPFVEKTYGIESGTVGLRFGDPRWNGGTVDHLHVHIIAADRDTEATDYRDVKFRMGPRGKKHP